MNPPTAGGPTPRTPRIAVAAILAAGSALALAARPLRAQHHDNDPYVVADTAFGQLPDGRHYGATSAVYPAPDGRSIWVAERCGQNSCIDRQDMTTVFRFDLDGRLPARRARGGPRHLHPALGRPGRAGRQHLRRGRPRGRWQQPGRQVYGAEVGPRTVRRYVRQR